MKLETAGPALRIRAYRNRQSLILKKECVIKGRENECRVFPSARGYRSANIHQGRKKQPSGLLPATGIADTCDILMSACVGVMDEKSMLAGQMMCANTLRLMMASNPTRVHFHLRVQAAFPPPPCTFPIYSAPVTVWQLTRLNLEQRALN